MGSGESRVCETLDCTRKCHIVTVWSIKLPPMGQQRELCATTPARKCNSIESFEHHRIALMRSCRWRSSLVTCCVTCSCLSQKPYAISHVQLVDGAYGGPVCRHGNRAFMPSCASANWQYLWTRTHFVAALIGSSPTALSSQLANYFHQNRSQFSACAFSNEDLNSELSQTDAFRLYECHTKS